MRRLVIRPGAIGDTIVGLPAVERLCSSRLGVDAAEIWAPSRNLPLLRHIAPVRSFTAVQLDLLEIDPPQALIERLRSFDEIVSWYGAAREEFRAALETVGVPFRLLRALPPEGNGLHAVDFYLKQAGFDAEIADMIAPNLPIVASLASTPGFIAVHPFSGSPRKNWDLTSFQAAAADLTDKTGLLCEWCVGPEEELAGARRFDTLDQVAQWLSGARLYLGNDSGISHLAAACGVPSVVIFRASNPSIWAPRGPQVAILENPAPALVVRTALDLVAQRERARKID